MSETCLIYEDIAYLGEEYLTGYARTVDDGGRKVVEQYGRFVIGKMFGDVLIAQDEVFGNRADTIRDALVATEQWLPVGRPVGMVSDAIKVRERYLPGRALVLGDELTIGEQWLQQTGAMLGDALAAAEKWLPVAHGRVMFGDVLRVQERYTQSWAAVFEDALTVGEGWSFARHTVLGDSATLTEQWLPIRHALGMLGDEVTVGEDWLTRRVPGTVFADALYVTEQWSIARTVRAVLSDELFTDERWLLPAVMVDTDGHLANRVGPTTAWTTNTDSWGMSRYAGLELNSLAVIDGVLYGASATGLYRLDGDDDGGEPVLGHVRTGLRDYGSEFTKSAPVVYAGAATDGDLQLTVDAVIGRVPSWYTYTFEPRHAGDFAPARCKVGRGVRARYMQFTAGNGPAGADFTIDTLSALASAGTRRV